MFEYIIYPYVRTKKSGITLEYCISSMTQKSNPIDLARALAEAIANGTYPVGSLLPTEFELCETHGLSRYAVRKALDELQELGLISRRKNVGTRVEASKPVGGFTQSIATVDELAQFGAQHIREIHNVDEVIADLSLAQKLDCQGGTRWLRISSLRRDSNPKARPICWTDVYVDAVFKGIDELVRHSPEILISSLLEEHYGRAIVRIRQEVEAILMPAELATTLQAEVGSPALRITRQYFDATGALVEISISVHPANRFKFLMEMSRNR